MAEPAHDYHRGEMDIQEQSATYDGFMALSKWGSLAIGAGLLTLVLLFCTKTGFLMSVIAGVIMLAVGIFALRGGKKTDAPH